MFFCDYFRDLMLARNKLFIHDQFPQSNEDSGKYKEKNISHDQSILDYVRYL